MTKLRLFCIAVALACFVIPNIEGVELAGLSGSKVNTAAVFYETGDTVKMSKGQKEIIQSNELKQKAKEKNIRLYFIDKDSDLSLMEKPLQEVKQKVKEIPALAIIKGGKATVEKLPNSVAEVKKKLGL